MSQATDEGTQVGASTTFRIGWGEAGDSSEGWYPWWAGATQRLRGRDGLRLQLAEL